MKRVCLLVVVLLAAIRAPDVAAQEGQETGNDLLTRCELAVRVPPQQESMRPEDAVDAAFCIGFVSGIARVVAVLPPKLRSCVPGGSTAGQWVRVVVRFLSDHAEALHEAGEVLVLRALQDAFPCQ